MPQRKLKLPPFPDPLWSSTAQSVLQAGITGLLLHHAADLLCCTHALRPCGSRQAATPGILN